MSKDWIGLAVILAYIFIPMLLIAFFDYMAEKEGKSDV